MLLNNFVSMMLGVIGYRYRPGAAVFKNLAGDTVQKGWDAGFPWFQQLKNNPSNFTDYGDYALVIGENNTPTSKDDYAFSLDLNNSLTVLSTATSYILDANGTRKLRFTKTISNDTAEDIIVKEVGIIIGLGRYSESDAFLIAREVLDTPITVKANGGTQVFGINIDPQ